MRLQRISCNTRNIMRLIANTTTYVERNLCGCNSLSNKRKRRKDFVKIWGLTLLKAAYVPHSRIKSNVVQLESFEQEIELHG